MKKKKPLLMVFCALLLVAASVMGTLAYMTSTTGEVTNTFMVGQLFDDNDSDQDPTPEDGPFVLYEHQATADGRGVYSIASNAAEVTSQSYVVLPGVNIKKDPFVRTDDYLEVDAYVFVEIVNNLPDVLTVEVGDVWSKVNGVTGSHGGDVYTLGVVSKGRMLPDVHILKNDLVVVADADISFTAGTDDTLVFYGYMIQAAGFDRAANAAEALFE